MSDKDSNQIEDLNQSRFLIEQLNLQQQPTQQEVLERAEQLEIDDLILARESLTKQLQPEWRPYCNRHSEIYYINLLQRLAYVDHPIDMYFKIEYAKNNGLPIPRFKNFKLEQISSNLELIEQQIRNFKMRSHKTTLRIVYEEPSQQQAISSHPKSPENGNEYDFQFEKDNQQLNVQQMQQLYAYERELQQKYEQQYLKNKKQMNNKEKRLADDHENFMRHLLDSKAEELSMKYEQQIMNKNKVDLRKQNEKIQNEYQQKRWQFCETIHKFNSVFQQLREKQRNIDVIYESKEASEKRTIVTAMEQKRQLQKLRAIEETKAKIMKQFNERLISINSNSDEYQRDLKNSLQDLYRQVTREGPKIIQRKRIFHQKGVEGDIGTRNRIERDFQYEQLKKEIKDLCLWSNSSSQISISDHHFSKPLRSSLNLRLRMRIL